MLSPRYSDKWHTPIHEQSVTDGTTWRLSIAVTASVHLTFASNPIAVSATEGQSLDALRSRIADALPDLRRAELTLPSGDDAMSLVSWLYDYASVEDVTYGKDGVRIAFAGHPAVVERARAEAEGLAVRT